MVGDADGRQQRSTVGVSQPCDLCCLLVVRVVQIQTSINGHDLTIRPSD